MVEKIISVTKRDIAKGVAGEYRSCPVALAINRALKLPNYEAKVHISYCEISYGGTDERKFALPAKVQRWIEHFDDTGLGRPFKFRLRVSR